MISPVSGSSARCSFRQLRRDLAPWLLLQPLARAVDVQTGAVHPNVQRAEIRRSCRAPGDRPYSCPDGSGWYRRVRDLRTGISRNQQRRPDEMAVSIGYCKRSLVETAIGGTSATDCIINHHRK